MFSPKMQPQWKSTDFSNNFYTNTHLTIVVMELGLTKYLTSPRLTLSQMVISFSSYTYSCCTTSPILFSITSIFKFSRHWPLIVATSLWLWLLTDSGPKPWLNLYHQTNKTHLLPDELRNTGKEKKVVDFFFPTVIVKNKSWSCKQGQCISHFPWFSTFWGMS